MSGILEKIGKPLMQKAFLVGLAAGAISVLYLLLLHLLGQHAFGQFKFLLISIYSLFFAFALWHYRKAQPGFKLSLREGLVLGIVLNIVATAVFFAGLYALLLSGVGNQMLAVHHEALINLLNQAKQMDSIGLTPADVEQTLANIKSINAKSLATDQLAFYYGFGVVNTVLMAMVFKH